MLAKMRPDRLKNAPESVWRPGSAQTRWESLSAQALPAGLQKNSTVKPN